MKTYTRATVIGHIGNEVVMRHTANGKAVVNLSIATDERRKDGVEVTTWHRAVLWDKLAEYAGVALKKGEPVYLEGRITANEWTDQEGVRRTRTEIVGYQLIRLNAQAGGTADLHDDLPLEVSRSARAGSSGMAGSDRHASVAADRGRRYGAGSADRGAPGRPRTGRAVDGEELSEVVEDIPF